jgi:DNA-binding NarL/FixJ family response regulator
MIRILLADDHSIVRSGLVKLLSGFADLQVVGEAARPDQVLSLARQGGLDLIVLDMNMPGPSGVPLIERLRLQRPEVPIVVLSMLNEGQIVSRALRAGAAGYVAKDSGIQVLREAIVRVAGGGRFIDPLLVEGVVFDHDRVGRARPDTLSARERQVLGMIVEGMRLGEIADLLHVSAKTISTHKMRLMQKLDVDNNADLVRFAIENGMARTPTPPRPDP